MASFQHPLFAAFKNSKDKEGELFKAAAAAAVCCLCGTRTASKGRDVNQAWLRVCQQPADGGLQATYVCQGVTITPDPAKFARYQGLQQEFEAQCAAASAAVVGGAAGPGARAAPAAGLPANSRQSGSCGAMQLACCHLGTSRRPIRQPLMILHGWAPASCLSLPQRARAHQWR
jgi:hypothetical protein